MRQPTSTIDIDDEGYQSGIQRVVDSEKRFPVEDDDRLIRATLGTYS